MSIVGGNETPLINIVIQEVYRDGIIARDGRLLAGDQILQVSILIILWTCIASLLFINFKLRKLTLWNLKSTKVSFTALICTTDWNLSVIFPISPHAWNVFFFFLPTLNSIPRVTPCLSSVGQLGSSWLGLHAWLSQGHPHCWNSLVPLALSLVHYTVHQLPSFSDLSFSVLITVI